MEVNLVYYLFYLFEILLVEETCREKSKTI